MTQRSRIQLIEIGVGLLNGVQSVSRFTQAWPLMIDTKQMGTHWEGAEGSEKHQWEWERKKWRLSTRVGGKQGRWTRQIYSAICEFFRVQKRPISDSPNLIGAIWKSHEFSPPPKDGEIALWPSTNGVIPCFLVLPGSELSITQITEYKYFCPLRLAANSSIKVSKMLYHWILLLHPFCFCAT